MHDECVTCAKKCAVAMGANVLKGLGEQGVKEFAKRQASGFIAVDLPMSRIIVFEDGSVVSPLTVSATINGIKQMPRYC